MTWESDLSDLLLGYLRTTARYCKQEDLKGAKSVMLSSYTMSGRDDGCPTCGYGSTQMSFSLYVYNGSGKKLRTIDIEADPLELLSEAMRWQDAKH